MSKQTYSPQTKETRNWDCLYSEWNISVLEPKLDVHRLINQYSALCSINLFGELRFHWFSAIRDTSLHVFNCLLIKKESFEENSEDYIPLPLLKSALFILKIKTNASFKSGLDHYIHEHE